MVAAVVADIRERSCAPACAHGHVEARRARAHAQGLHGQPRFSDPAAVRHRVGVQAKGNLAAALAIRARTTGLTAVDGTAQA